MQLMINSNIHKYSLSFILWKQLKKFRLYITCKNAKLSVENNLESGHHIGNSIGISFCISCLVF